MRRADGRRRAVLTAVGLHDAAVLAAVFHAPILWGQVCIPETHSPESLSASGGQAVLAALVGLAVLAMLAARWLAGRGPARLPNAVHLPTVVLLGVAAVSAAFSMNLHASTLELARLLTMAALFFLVANRAALPAAEPRVVAAAFGCSVVLLLFIPTPAEAGAVLKVLGVLGIGATAASVMVHRDDPDPIRWWRDGLILSAVLVVALYGLREKVVVWRELDNPTWQVFSTFFNPNPLGGFFAMVFPLAVSATLTATALGRRVVWGFCAAMLAGMILPTYSKGAMLAIVAAVIVYVLALAWRTHRGRRAVIAALAVVGLVVLLGAAAVLLVEPARERAAAVASSQSASNMFRILTWKGTLGMAAAHPWLGVGPAAFKYVYPKYAIAGYVEAAHQNYLQMFAELGVAGGLAFLWLLGSALFTAARAAREGADFSARVLAVSALAGISALMVHSLLEYNWYVGAINLTFWLLVGMAAHIAHGGRLVEVPAADEAESGRRRRARRDSRVAMPEPQAARRLPWPARSSGRAAALTIVLFAFCWLVWVPARSARAQQLVDEGNALAMAGRGPTAVVRFEAATRYDPGWADAWERYGLVRGVVYERELDESVDLLRHAMELAPTSFRPPSSLGQLYAEHDHLAKAAEAYEKALELFPQHTKTMRRLAETYDRMGDRERALAIYRRMIEVEQSPYNRYRALEDVDVDTNFAYAHYELGRAAMREGKGQAGTNQLGEAMRHFEAAMGVIEAYFARAAETDRMFALLQRPRENRAEDMRKLEAKVRWRMADVLEQMGEENEARQERVRARALSSGVEAAVEAERRREQP